jgi:hypothetical protein
MKQTSLTVMLIAAAAQLPAQFGGDPCSLYRSSYSASGCLFRSMGEHRSQEQAMALSAVESRRREWAAIEAQYPPAVIGSRAGKRVAPRRNATHAPGAGAQQTEAAEEALLDSLDNGLRTSPAALLDLPPNHLATALMMLAVRSYMVTRNLEDASPYMVVDRYDQFRRSTVNAATTKLMADAAEAQYVFENLLLINNAAMNLWEAQRDAGLLPK